MDRRLSGHMSRSLVVLLAGLLLGSLLGACGEDGPADPGRDGPPTTLAGTQWRAVTIGSAVPPVGGEPTLAFGTSEVKGSGGCNSFGGSYRYDPSGEVRFAELGMTAMACQDNRRNEVETAFMQMLGRVAQASIDARGLLVLSGPGGEIRLANAAFPNPTD